MQRIAICAVGKLKEAYFRGAAQEYMKRLSRYCKLELIELEDLPAPERLSDAQRMQIVEKEGAHILSRLMPRDYVIALAIGGKRYTSEALSSALRDLERGGYARIVFLIGGSLGLSKACLARSDIKLSLSDMTLPHQLARIVMLEQLYRGYKIMKNESYHK